jgi:hypothetical protein
MNITEMRFATLHGFDKISVVASACAFLEGAGYSGSFSAPVVEALEWRFDMCQETGQTLSAFMAVVTMLCHDGTGNGPNRDSLLKRVNDQDQLLKTIQESNGEMSRRLRGDAR